MTKQNETITPQAARDVVSTALELLTREQTDALIGDVAPAEGALLVRAATAQHQLLYAMLVQLHRLPNNARTRETIAKSQLVVARLIEIAYAKGIERGRRQS